MSNKKTQTKHSSFRLTIETIENIEEIMKENPIVFSSKQRVLSAAVGHFRKLDSKTKVEALKTVMFPEQ